MIDGGRRISWLEAPRIGDEESGGCFSDVHLFFGPLGFFMFMFFIFWFLGPFWLFIGVVWPLFGSKFVYSVFV